MRILIVVHGYPPTYRGGAELRAERTAHGLLKRGHEVAVLTVESCSSKTGRRLDTLDSVQDGVRVRRLSYDLGSAPDVFTWSYDHPQIASAMSDFIAEAHPDLVHLFSGYLMGNSVARVGVIHGVPMVASLTDYWWLCHRINLVRPDGSRCESGPSPTACAQCSAGVHRSYRRAADVWPWAADKLWDAASHLSTGIVAAGRAQQEKRATALLQGLAEFDALIAPSHFLAETYVRAGVDHARMHVFRQGVNLAACPIRRPSETLRVGYIGQMKRHKGVDLLLTAWRSLSGERPRSLKLFGSDEGEDAYGQTIRQILAQSTDASWDGQFPRSELWRVLSELDVLVVPSRWVENSPNTILEAQAMGIPVVGSNLGGVAELVRHERNGLLFTVDDAEDLQKQLQRLLDDPELVARLRRSPIPFKSTEEAVDELVHLYHSVSSGYALRHERAHEGRPEAARTRSKRAAVPALAGA